MIESIQFRKISIQDTNVCIQVGTVSIQIRTVNNNVTWQLSIFFLTDLLTRDLFVF